MQTTSAGSNSCCANPKLSKAMFTLKPPSDSDAPVYLIDTEVTPAPHVEPVAAPASIDVEPPPSPSKPAPPRRATAAVALGFHVEARALHGVLMQPATHGYEVLRQFTRQRIGSDSEYGGGGPEFDLPLDDGGVTMQIGASGADDLFMSGEFGALPDVAPGLDVTSSAAGHGGSPIVFELKDVLEECQAAGFDKPEISFVISQPDVEYVELTVPVEKKKTEKAESKSAQAKKKAKKGAGEVASSGSVKPERLLALLAEAYENPFDKERVGFIEMTPREGLRRFMAVVATNSETVTESIELLREQNGLRKVPFRTLDSEVSALAGLALLAHRAESGENYSIVRVGLDDTLVILLEGGRLHHAEHMRSVTTLDSPETICSRVLLQQDVQGIGTVHRVIISSEARESELVQGFAAFYPEAEVDTLSEGLAAVGVVGEEGPLMPAELPAAAAALRTLLRKERDTPFDGPNLLPARLQKRKRHARLVLSWHTLVAAVVLFLLVLFFTAQYFSQQRQIQEAENRLAAYPAELSMSAEQLQAEILDNQMRIDRTISALRALDSLLVGSDRWSNALSRTNIAVSNTAGTWISAWAPQGEIVSFEGYATSRDRVVSFAERMNGSIEQLSFDMIRDFPVYRYLIQVPVPSQLPQVTLYLREQVGSPVTSLAPLMEPLLSQPMHSGPVNNTPAVLDAPIEN